MSAVKQKYFSKAPCPDLKAGHVDHLLMHIICGGGFLPLLFFFFLAYSCSLLPCLFLFTLALLVVYSRSHRTFADYANFLRKCFLTPHFTNGAREVHLLFDNPG